MSSEVTPQSGLRWLNERQVSDLTGISVSTLQKNRFKRRGIPYCKVGGHCVRYSLQDVRDFMQACRVDVSASTL